MFDQLRAPRQLLRRNEVLARPCPIPRVTGLYAWYIAGLPVPTEHCHFVDESPLVYIGIAPSSPGSRATLRSRIRQHARGNASSSTLRLSLGCLLAPELGITLQRVGRRLTFGDGEAVLNAWLDEHARVAWMAHDAPWEVESTIIAGCDLPLNIQHNKEHPFRGELKRIRRAARSVARDAVGQRQR